MTAVDLDPWRSQLRKGAAELAVLSVLRRGESYGLELLERLRSDDGLELSDGSIYPLLNRLQKEGKIRARWVQDPDATHPRKYYALTPHGEVLGARMTEEWHRFSASVSRIVDREAERV